MTTMSIPSAIQRAVATGRTRYAAAAPRYGLEFLVEEPS